MPSSHVKCFGGNCECMEYFIVAFCEESQKKRKKIKDLGCSGDHVLDEVTMAGGVDDGDVVLGSLELPESNVDGDSTLALSLELVENPRVLEGSLSHIVGLLLELLDGSLVNTSALVDQVTGGG
jgi:hypothetical protein